MMEIERKKEKKRGEMGKKTWLFSQYILPSEELLNVTKLFYHGNIFWLYVSEKTPHLCASRRSFQSTLLLITNVIFIWYHKLLVFQVILFMWPISIEVWYYFAIWRLDFNEYLDFCSIPVSFIFGWCCPVVSCHLDISWYPFWMMIFTGRNCHSILFGGLVIREWWGSSTSFEVERNDEALASSFGWHWMWKMRLIRRVQMNSTWQQLLTVKH